MKKLLAVISFVFVIGTLPIAGLSQEKSQDADRAKKAAAYMAIAGPGPEHKQLESLVGTWDQEIKFWMEPGKPPVTFKGRTQNRMILGGRFLLSEGKGGEGAMAFERVSIMGFDRRHKKYTTVEFDSMGTYYVTGMGPYDEARKAIVTYGEDVDPMLGHTQKYDMITRIVSPTQYVVEVIFKDFEHTQGRGDRKIVEVTSTKVAVK